MQRGLTDKERRRSASTECQALRDLVNKLKVELLQSQVETQKVRDQLQCVIYLVRRAWQGDETATRHVAKIVGVAPPKIQKSELNEFTATPKSRALNGWARLVIGLLNRMYCEEELDLRAKQLLYMRDREELLDEQLMSHKDVMQHQTNVALLQSDTLQLLQAREEERARERAEERERLEQQKLELQAKFRRRVPPNFHSHNLARKDSVQREADLDIAGNLLVSPVRSQNKDCVSSELEHARHTNSLEDLEDEKIREEASPTGSQVKSERKSSDDIFLTRRRSSSLSRDEANLPKEKKQGSHHVRSQTGEGTGKGSNVRSSRPRPKTAAVKSSSTVGSSGTTGKRRPLSAHVSQPMPWSKPPPTFNTSKTRRQLDVIERDLKLTTKALQDRLGISKQGFV
ncbi:hypothetical protein ACROYT_G012745 [Oculina patagonica]